MEPTFRRWRPFEARCRAFLRSAPDHPLGLAMLTQCLSDVGRWRDALVFAQRWRAVSPDRVTPRNVLARTYWQAGRLSEAEATFDEIARQWPSHAISASVRVNFLVLLGRADDAAQAFEQIRRDTRMPTIQPPDLALELARAIASTNPVIRRQAIAHLKQARARHSMGAAPALAFLCALDDVDDAFEVLPGYMFGGSAPWRPPFRPHWPIERGTDLLFGLPQRPLRDDPRFAIVTRAVGLDDYWRATGTSPDR